MKKEILEFKKPLNYFLHQFLMDDALKESETAFLARFIFGEAEDSRPTPYVASLEINCWKFMICWHLGLLLIQEYVPGSSNLDSDQRRLDSDFFQ